MPARSKIERKDLIRVARLLAAGETHARGAATLGWDKNRFNRCVARLHSEVQQEGERCWSSTRETALEWLRMRDACTPAELERARAMARDHVRQGREELLLSVKQMRDRREYALAEHTLRRYLRDDPEDVDALLAFGHCLAEAGHHPDALAAFADLRSRNPADVRSLLGKASTLRRMGAHDEAAAELEAALKHDPDNESILAWLGNWQLQADRNSDRHVAIVQRAMDVMIRKYSAGSKGHPYCREIAEVAFIALWDAGRADTAVALARTAAEYGWQSMKVARYVADHEEAMRRAAAPAVTTAARQVSPKNFIRFLFHVLVRAHAETRPPHWPDRSVGCLTQYSVAALTAMEARSVVSAQLQPGDPPSVQFDLEVVQTQVQLFAPQPWAVAGPPQWTLAASEPPPAPPREPEAIAGPPPQPYPTLRRPRPRQAPPRRRPGGSHH
jgi:tetratricopeptide (TPR) repeat protein